jgi:hypothetical protein
MIQRVSDLRVLQEIIIFFYVQTYGRPPKDPLQILGSYNQFLGSISVLNQGLQSPKDSWVYFSNPNINQPLTHYKAMGIYCLIHNEMDYNY